MSLEVKLKKQLGNFLLDVDFSVPDGSATGLLGASGCGKDVYKRQVQDLADRAFCCWGSCLRMQA